MNSIGKTGPTQAPPTDKTYSINLSWKSLQLLVKCMEESFIFLKTLRRQTVVPLIRIDMKFYVKNWDSIDIFYRNISELLTQWTNFYSGVASIKSELHTNRKGGLVLTITTFNLTNSVLIVLTDPTLILNSLVAVFYLLQFPLHFPLS